ncbi:MAG: glycosyltransferase family 4 protein [Polyangiaceae bacterium]|nr:glycosyltransferase family 4 protein [Myxococcales bacterium]MCB9584149.1 glycosyltransferase family 4 protein [Polyangiaceae bacterium]MCB9608689.1 glycosyltransferase family 4 protein [Polyangiaceae bacterium]
MRQVLFVSKPIAPPFHDGTKCLVRDLSGELQAFKPLVMGQPGVYERAGVVTVPVYRGAGGFSPPFADNARAAVHLLRSSAADVWHFVFAPNALSSGVGRVARRVRGIPTVQTVASPPQRFRGASEWLFGDIVVAQSTWTAKRLMAEARAPRVEVVPPCVGAIAQVSREAQAEMRLELDVPASAPLFVYPGDWETSSGAEVVAEAAQELTRSVPDAFVVFACRQKSAAAKHIELAMKRRLQTLRVRFAGELKSILPLIATSSAVLFPVDDLRGKVDLPIVLLEAMALGVPIVVASGGPLDDLESVCQVPPRDPHALVQACVGLTNNPECRIELIEKAKGEVRERFSARRVAQQYELLYERALRLTA